MKIVLAQGYASDWSIYLDLNATDTEVKAAEDFQSIFEEISGVELPITSDKTIQRIEIGGTEDGLGLEGYALHVHRNLVQIKGGIRGILYGVYSFFEDYLGCRWFTKNLTVLPQRDEVSVPELDKRFVPAMNYRRTSFMDSQDVEWCVANKINAGVDIPEEQGSDIQYGVGFVHTIQHIIPDSMFAEHPEYFPMRDGKRQCDKHFQRCLTNPDVLAITIETVKQAFRDNPKAMIASVSQNDTYPDAPNNCECPACKAIDDEEGSLMGSFLRFVNAVADAVKEEFPDRYIDTLAYRYTRKPPKITKPRDNVIIRLCSIECCFSHTMEGCNEVYADDGIGTVGNAEFVQDIKDWAKIAKNLHIWDYVVNFPYYPAPHPNIHVMKDNMKFFANHNVIGVYPEGAHDTIGSDMAELKAWLQAKLQWDPDFDVDRGIEDFLAAYCGHGAAPIARYLKELNDKPEREHYHMSCYARPKRAFFTSEFMDFAEKCFDQAEDMAEDEEVLDRIRFWRWSLKYIRLMLYAKDMEEQELMVKFADFFQNMKHFGIGSVMEGGRYESSVGRMWKLIQENLKA